MRQRGQRNMRQIGQRNCHGQHSKEVNATCGKEVNLSHKTCGTLSCFPNDIWDSHASHTTYVTLSRFPFNIWDTSNRRQPKMRQRGQRNMRHAVMRLSTPDNKITQKSKVNYDGETIPSQNRTLAINSNQIQLLTKFESGHLIRTDRQTDRLTERPTDR
ncbi:hypothetical protein DPMN_181604 [Dreissena polymorpha]|uniref:Uncharacterized protein n=1 Tax=Dreissena polymorpha TaxID=45954 RepID=A0A9D4DDV6_DREPO|nr:hypothetical protein DPMN_181604 [Dreissena polymorpha]